MSITHLSNQNAIYVSYDGMGVCLAIQDGKLVPVELDTNETAEIQLNRFRGILNRFVESYNVSLSKCDVIRPMLQLVKLTSGLPDDVFAALSSKLDGEVEKARKTVATVQSLLVDVTDLMLEYNVPIHKLDEENQAVDPDKIDGNLQDLLARLSKKD